MVEEYLATLWYYQGVLYARLDKWATAEECFVRSLRVNFDSYEAMSWLYAICKAQHKRFAGALLLPFVWWNGLAKRRRDDKEQANILSQRASLSRVTLEQVQALTDQ